MSKKLSEEEFLKATLTKFTRVKNEVHQKLNDTLNETINKINLSLSINGKPSFVNSFLNESDINPELLQKYIDKQYREQSIVETNKNKTHYQNTDDCINK